MIEIKGITKKYGDHYAVKDISFTLEKGKIYGLLGTNGAGKSTTMNIMTGCLAATEGEVLIDGLDIYEQSRAVKQKTGYLPERPPLYMEMTPYEYLIFVAKAKKVPRINWEDEVNRVICKLELSSVQDRLIRNLSKGYQQRVGIAQALLGNPEIIILDEPTVGLDPKQMIEIRSLIRELGAEHTVLLSSHILSEVQAVCDEIIIIAHGEIVAKGTPEALEKQLVGGIVYTIAVKGDKETILQIISSLSGIEDYSITPSAQEKLWELVLTVTKDSVKEEDISLALCGVGCPIIRMNRKQAGLEELFLEVTETNDQNSKELAQSEREKNEGGENSGSSL